MTEVDTSIYNNLQTSGSQPLNMLSSVAGVQNQLNQARLFQQEFAGRLALGKLYSAAPLDANGNPDQTWIQKNAGQAGIMAPEATQNALEAQAKQLSVQSQQLQNAKTRSSIAGAALMPLASNPNTSASDFLDATNDLVAKGYFTADDQHQAIMGLASHLKTGTPQSYAKGIVAKTLSMGGNPEYGMKILAGEPGTIDTGAAIQPVTTDVTSGKVTPAGGAINKDLPPTTQRWNPDTGQYEFGGGSSNPSAPPAQAGGTPTQGPTPTPLQGAFKPSSNTGHTASPGNPIAAPNPGSLTMMTAAGSEAQKRVDETISTARTAPISQDVNRQIISLADKLGSEGAIGPTRTDVTHLLGQIEDTPGLRSVMNLVRGSDKPANDAPGQLMELKKYLLRAAQTRASSLGLGTDYQQGINVDANPNDKQFPEVIQKLAKYNLALDYVDQGRANALQGYPGATSDPKKQQEFEDKFRNALNVNVYRALLSSPSERHELYDSMTKTEKEQLPKDLRGLIKMNAIPDSLLRQAQGGQ